MRPSHRPHAAGKSDARGPSERDVISTISRARADAIEQDAVAAKIEFYRNEAQRLLRLAAAATVDDAKAQFLALAQQYETLADHTAERARRLRS